MMLHIMNVYSCENKEKKHLSLQVTALLDCLLHMLLLTDTVLKGICLREQCEQ